MTTVTQGSPPNNGQPASAPAPVVMVRQAVIAAEDVTERVWKRQVPAWALSAALHLLLIGIFVGLAGWRKPDAATGSELQVVETRVEDAPEAKQNFENTDIGLDPTKETNYNIDRIDTISVPGKFRPDEPVGITGAPDGPPQTLPPPPGFGGGQGGGVAGDLAGSGKMFGDVGGWLGGVNLPGAAFTGRSGATRQKMLVEGGGNAASEAAVARGLKYLQRVQKKDGHWSLDGSYNDDIAGTGLALLPFLAAGQTHRPLRGEKESIYAKTVEAGLAYLRNKQKANGSFGASQMYGDAIAIMAVCEAYGMTQDPSLKRPAQLGVDYLVKAQHPAGGWRYRPGQAGDTSVTGWCVQALKSGYLAGLSVPRETMARAGTFLDSVQGQNGAAYGYTGPGGSPNLNAVGLLCRQYLGWGPKNPALVAGVENLKKQLPERGQGEIYYYYYATQVIHFFGGDDWDKVWNPRMRDLLIATQDASPAPTNGSWPPDRSPHTQRGGRLMMTTLSLLTLEVYYRHLPLYKRSTAGPSALEG